MGPLRFLHKIPLGKVTSQTRGTLGSAKNAFTKPTRPSTLLLFSCIGLLASSDERKVLHFLIRSLVDVLVMVAFLPRAKCGSVTLQLRGKRHRNASAEQKMGW